MTGAYLKTLVGSIWILVLTAGMVPQAPTSTGSNQTTEAASTPAVPAQAQELKPAPVYESSTVLKSITRLVVVDVVATDKDGAITDLKQDDFTLLEDGKEQKLRVFNFQQPRADAPRAVAISAPRPPENVYSNVARFSASSALNILLLDALNTNLPHQAYVRDQMIRYLEKMPEGQPVAVYMLSTKLTLLQDFTDDPAVLKKVATEIKSNISPLQDNPTGGPDMELLPAGLADSGLVPAQMVNAIESFERERVAFQTDLRINYSINALTSIARSLSGYPGRKNLIWISEAFPLVSTQTWN